MTSDFLVAALMRLTFLGTRGEIEACSRQHFRHSALLVAHGRTRVLVDCGADWRGRVAELAPGAIVLTHGHPDHARGLVDGAPCPVYATTETLELLRRYPLAERRPIAPRRRTDVCGITFEAFTLEHSLRAPAVGFRVSAGGRRFFYAPDLVSIHQRAAALAGLDLYIGDGASLERDIVRRRGGRLIGHASVREQLRWCAEARVPRVVITHCGTQIVTGHAAKIEAWLQASAREHGLELRLAHDGMVVSLRRHA